MVRIVAFRTRPFTYLYQLGQGHAGGSFLKFSNTPNLGPPPSPPVGTPPPPLDGADGGYQPQRPKFAAPPVPLSTARPGPPVPPRATSPPKDGPISPRKAGIDF